MHSSTRRRFLGTGAASLSLGFAPAAWTRALGIVHPELDSPYGPLSSTPDANGLYLPANFQSRVIARTDQVVAGTGYTWHAMPDGGATFPVAGGGWVYVSNSELPRDTDLAVNMGGVGAIKFDAGGTIVGAYSILSNTRRNCGGGKFRNSNNQLKWLSCEEVATGYVYECNPMAAGNGTRRAKLGKFNHEAAVEDPDSGCIYMTEDDPLSRLYRFVPQTKGNLSSGQLQAAQVGANGNVTWRDVSDTKPARGDRTTAFNNGEGAWFDNGVFYFCTTGDDKVWAYSTVTNQCKVIYSATDSLGGNILHSPDAITVHHETGHIYVAEDSKDGNPGDPHPRFEVVLLADAAGNRIGQPFLRLEPSVHVDSEPAGLAFSPDGTRLYFSAQGSMELRNGVTLEITGPFRTTP